MGETGKLTAEMIFGLGRKGWNIPPAEGRKYYRRNFQARRMSQIDSILEEVTVNKVSAMNCGC